jgi:hypothetical protein
VYVGLVIGFAIFIFVELNVGIFDDVYVGRILIGLLNGVCVGRFEGVYENPDGIGLDVSDVNRCPEIKYILRDNNREFIYLLSLF